MRRPRDAADRLRVLMVSGEWPSPSFPGVSPSVARTAEVIRRAGADVEPFEFRGSMQLRAYRRARTDIHVRANQMRYDVLHAHHVQCGLVAMSAGLPVVVSLDEQDIGGLNRRRSALARAASLRLSRLVARRADAVIVPSRSSAQRLGSNGQVHVLPWGVDLDVFRPAPRSEARRELDLRADRKIVLYAGDPHAPWPPYVCAVDAISCLRNTLDVTMLTVEREPPRTVARFLNACDVVLVTCDSEAAVLMAKQALACEVPVIMATPTPRDWPEHAPGWWQCPDTHAAAVAAMIAQVLRSSPANGGDLRIAEHVDDHALGHQIVDVYNDVARVVGA